jgi:hypothetical protein
MKDDTPHGSVFGGYGFFSYPGRGTTLRRQRQPRCPAIVRRPGLRQRMLLRSASGARALDPQLMPSPA